MRRLEPHDRIHPGELGMSRENRAGERAVEGGKLEDPSAIMPENELHALGTEPAGAIIE